MDKQGVHFEPQSWPKPLLRRLFAIETKRHKEAGEDFDWDVIPHYISNNLRVLSVTRASNCFHRESTENSVLQTKNLHLGCNLILNLNSEENMIHFSHYSVDLTVDTQNYSYILQVVYLVLFLEMCEYCTEVKAVSSWSVCTSKACKRTHCN